MWPTFARFDCVRIMRRISVGRNTSEGGRRREFRVTDRQAPLYFSWRGVGSFRLLQPRIPVRKISDQLCPWTVFSLVQILRNPKGRGTGLEVSYFSGWRAATISITFSSTKMPGSATVS